jgi:hypothetical protein
MVAVVVVFPLSIAEKLRFITGARWLGGTAHADNTIAATTIPIRYEKYRLTFFPSA